MLKNQNLAEQILEIINTGIEAANQMMAFLQDITLEVFDEVAHGLYQMIQSVRVVADELKAEEDGLTLPAATESIMVSIVRIRGIAKQDREKAQSKIEFELIPLMEEMRVHFYYWGMVYPDPVKIKKYYDEDIHWLACNKYQQEAEESGIYKYDLSIVVLAYNKLDYTKKCIEGLLVNLPKTLSYEIIFFNHGSTDRTKEVFEIFSPHKQVDIAVNGGGLGVINRITEGRYVCVISNDVVITKNALLNMYKCISSDENIGWVVPSTPNVSNLQSLPCDYKSLEGLKAFAEHNNVSDYRRWEQRVRLCNPIDMTSAKFLHKVKPAYWFHSKNAFSFPDDRLGLLCRRQGYKMYLVKDAYCHHFGSVTLKEDEKTSAEIAYLKGRQDFYQLFHLDPWSKGFCFSPNLFSKVALDKQGDVTILGINCGMGGNSLKIKEELKEKVSNTTVKLVNITTEESYYSDLKGISDEAECMEDYHQIKDRKEQFDYILLDGVSYKKDELLSDVELFTKKAKENGVIIMLLTREDAIWLEQKTEFATNYTSVEFIGESEQSTWVVLRK